MPAIKQAAYVGRIEKALSNERLAKFRLSPSEPRWEQLARYAWNVAVSEAFYPLLHHLEVVLRNQVYAAGDGVYPCSRYADIPCWLDALPSPLHPKYGAGGIRKAKEKLFASRRSGVPARTYTPGDLVAALDFGFWTGMFNSHYTWQRARETRACGRTGWAPCSRTARSSRACGW